MGSLHTEVPNPGVAAFGFAAQTKPVRFENAGASALHTLPFGFNPGDAVTGTQGIGVCPAEVCSLHRHLLDHFLGRYVLNLLPSSGVRTL